MTDQQYVSLVAQGGTPVRLADQRGTPYPTTGYGALVFANGASLSNTTLTNATLIDPVFELIDLVAGRAILQTPTRLIFSEKIVAENACRIADAFQTPAGTTVSVRLTKEHGLVSGARISSRIGGWNGVTLRAHPGNGDNLQVTVVDAYTLILNGTVWATNSIFLHGIVWTGTLDDARPTLTELFGIIEEEGPSKLTLPPGVIPLMSLDLSAGSATVLALPAGLHMAGQGLDQTSFFLGDYVNGFALQSIGTSDIVLEDFAILGNRQYQGPSGYHALRFGALGVRTNNVTVSRVAVLGSAGYGIGLQSDFSSFTNFTFDQILISECDSDGMDVKNRDDGNDANRFINSRVYHAGLGVIGVDVDPVTLGTNPFTTTNGSAVVTVAHNAHPLKIGTTVTFSGATTVNGVDPNKTVTVLSVATNSYTVNFGQTATGSGSGGGSSVLEYAATWSPGDAYIDMRGKAWVCSGNHCQGDMRERGGIRLRIFDVVPNPEAGGIRSVVADNTIINDNAVFGIGVYVGDDAAAVYGNTGENLTYGLYVPAGTGATLGGFTGTNCNHVVYIEAAAGVVTVNGVTALRSLISSFLTRANNTTFNGCTSIDSVLGYNPIASTNAAFNGCVSSGDTTTHQDNGTGTIWNSPQFAQRERILTLPTAGTTNPTTLTEADIGKVIHLPFNATETAVVYLPAPSARVVGGSFSFVSNNTSFGFQIYGNGTGIRIGSTFAAANSFVSSASAGACVDLINAAAGIWIGRSAIGTW